MTGQEERTIAQKLADSNRPTWEQYKKDNEDKLNLEKTDVRIFFTSEKLSVLTIKISPQFNRRYVYSNITNSINWQRY